VKYLLAQLALLVVILVAALQLIGPANEPFTELYFADHQNLPASLNPPAYAVERIESSEASFYAVTYVNEIRDIAVIEVFERSQTLNESQIDERFPLSMNLSNASALSELFTASTGVIRYRVQSEKFAQNITLTEPFAFTIVNREGKPTTYEYLVAQQNHDEASNTLLNGTLTLAHNESQTIAAHFSVIEGFNRTQILVTLIDRPERIHFWVEETQ
jgi:hypothetical protein